VIAYPALMSKQPRQQHACTVADRDMPDGVLATTCPCIPGAAGAALVDAGRSGSAWLSGTASAPASLGAPRISGGCSVCGEGARRT